MFLFTLKFKSLEDLHEFASDSLHVGEILVSEKRVDTCQSDGGDVAGGLQLGPGCFRGEPPNEPRQEQVRQAGGDQQAGNVHHTGKCYY